MHLNDKHVFMALWLGCFNCLITYRQDTDILDTQVTERVIGLVTSRTKDVG